MALIASGCARPVIPDPREAAHEYAQAVERGDAEAVYGMLTEAAQRRYGQDRAAELLADSKAELGARARAVASPTARVDAGAVVPFDDGETAVLALEDGVFRISAAAALPTGARTPSQALAELRQVLARRSYAGLMRVLSPETRGALEADVSGLVTGLERPSTLEVDVQGDRAEVVVPGGHKVWLKRESGVWRVHDFD